MWMGWLNVVYVSTTKQSTAEACTSLVVYIVDTIVDPAMTSMATSVTDSV